MDLQQLVEPDRVHKHRVHRPGDLRRRDGEASSSAPGSTAATNRRSRRRATTLRDHRPPADDHGARPVAASTCCYNRCPHRGVQLVGNQSGNTGSAFVCSYHAWSFKLDGSVRAIPLAKGYEGTRLTRDNPDCNDEARGARGQTAIAASCLPAWWTMARRCSTSWAKPRWPSTTCATARRWARSRWCRICHRVVQHSNWKFFMENQLDALHPSVTHQSTGMSAAPGRTAPEGCGPGAAAVLPLCCRPLRPASTSGTVQTINFPHGHGILKAYMGLRPQDDPTRWSTRRS
jgi:hypothetical protein